MVRRLQEQYALINHTCENCGIGRYRQMRVPYLLPLGSRMLVMPNAPAYQCDVCSFRTFDHQFLSSVHRLIEQVTEDPQRHARRRSRWRTFSQRAAVD